MTFEVSAGGITGLLGPSGSGKTTLIRAIVGVQRHVRGELRVLGQPAGSAPLRRRVGYRTQDPAVYADLTVRENLEYFAAILGAPRAQVAEVIRQVELDDVAGQLARSLSGGQHSRVSLATAFLGEPELLVLDEPTVGLDPVLRETLWQLFRSLSERGATLLVSSHVMDEAARCDEVLLLRNGSAVDTGDASGTCRAHRNRRSRPGVSPVDRGAVVTGTGATTTPCSAPAAS